VLNTPSALCLLDITSPSAGGGGGASPFESAARPAAISGSKLKGMIALKAVLIEISANFRVVQVTQRIMETAGL
jgi:hypothetical protein